MFNVTKTISSRGQILGKIAKRSTTAVKESVGVRLLSDNPVTVELEHSRGEWKTFGIVKNYNPGKFQIETFNKISSAGLKEFPEDDYEIISDDEVKAKNNSHAILLRSHKLQESEIKQTVRAIAR